MDIITESVDAYPKRFTGQTLRRAFLCGDDPDTHINYDYRRQWIENRILELAEVFSVEAYAYAVMHNHYRLVIYSDPRAPEKWSDNDVAERWLKVFPGKLDQSGYTTQRANKIQMILKDPQFLAIYRERLGSVSWLVRRINLPLAKIANAEDKLIAESRKSALAYFRKSHLS